MVCGNVGLCVTTIFGSVAKNSESILKVFPQTQIPRCGTNSCKITQYVGKDGLNYTFPERNAKRIIIFLSDILVGYNYFQKVGQNSPNVAEGETKGYT